MKYIKSFLCIALVCLLFSGCSFRMSSSIEDLISPVSPIGQNADIQNALNNYLKTDYSLKAPSGGDNISAYNFKDVDNDEVEEAFAFYELNDNIGTINMALIDKVGKKWSVIDTVEIEGSDIYSISFDDINGDATTEIFVCSDAISNTPNHFLNVYKLVDNDGLKFELLDNSLAVNNYICVDFDGDGVNELLTFTIPSIGSSAKADLYSFSSGSFELLGTTKLDSHISSYSKLQIENAENDIRVYADAVGSNSTFMLTEVIYWSNTYDTIVSPFYSYNTGLTADTTHNAIITSRDINSDNLIEIPIDYSLYGIPSAVKVVDWKIYKNTTLIHVSYSLLVEKDNYYVNLPSGIIDELSIEYNDDNRELAVNNGESGDNVFSIIPVLKATYNEGDYKDYSVVLDDSGYYYLAKSGNDSEIKISIDDLKSSVKSVN